MKVTKYLSLLFLGASLVSCGEDFLTDMPSDSATLDQVEDQANKNPEKVLASQINGCYTNWNTAVGINANNINGHMSVGFAGIMMLSDAMSNDISLALGDGDPWHFDHTLDYFQQEYVRAGWPWGFFYTIINAANEVINVVDRESTTDAGRYILGQALAFRGISHAYLAQFYQRTYADGNNKELPGVPLRLSSKETSITGRAPLKKIFEQAERDLLDAIDLLDGYQRPDKTTIDKSVAQGLLSRVYLVMNRWADAAAMAHEARQGYQLNTPQQTAEWNYQELANGEAMWGFDPTDSNKLYYGSFASWRSIDGPGYAGYQTGAMQLIDAALYKSIPANDARKEQFVAPGESIEMGEGATIPEYANLKFLFVSQWLGDVIYMRVAEMYLNEAEGLLKSGDKTGADAVMAEFMPNRVTDWTAPLGGFNEAQIYTQRRIELWGEGFGYFDCRRLKQDLVRNYEGTNEPAGTRVNIPYDAVNWTYQLPLSEIRDNDEISEEDQNPGQ